MIRRIIKIDEEKCNGCGLCVDACHEDAIILIDGKARLIKDDYCDGLGDCLPTCPTGAISFEEREAAPYDEEAVKARIAAKQSRSTHGGCPGSRQVTFNRQGQPNAPAETERNSLESQLNQWPVQIKLVPVNAPYFNGANLLIAADCTPFAYANFHEKFIKNRITLIGCPKLDQGSYAEKLTEIIKHNDIKSVTVVRMEVPCCGGIVSAVKEALQNSGKMIPWQIATISIDGQIVEQ